MRRFIGILAITTTLILATAAAAGPVRHPDASPKGDPPVVGEVVPYAPDRVLVRFTAEGRTAITRMMLIR